MLSKFNFESYLKYSFVREVHIRNKGVKIHTFGIFWVGGHTGILLFHTFKKNKCSIPVSKIGGIHLPF